MNSQLMGRKNCKWRKQKEYFTFAMYHSKQKKKRKKMKGEQIICGAKKCFSWDAYTSAPECG